jgi:hypothetical protein
LYKRLFLASDDAPHSSVKCEAERRDRLWKSWISLFAACPRGTLCVTLEVNPDRLYGDL